MRQDNVTCNFPIYHKPNCHTLRNANSRNLKNFQSWEAAVAEGMKPCGVCKPTFFGMKEEVLIGNVYTYHRPDCHILNNVDRHRLTKFQSWEAAVAEGMKPCGVCKPTFFGRRGGEVLAGIYAYHLPYCPLLKHTHPMHLERYSSWKEAEDQRKWPCKLCCPSLTPIKKSLPAIAVANVDGTSPILDTEKEPKIANVVSTKEFIPEKDVSVEIVQPSEPFQGHLTISEDARGWSYRRIFAKHLKGARRITVKDPYIRIKYQMQNLVEFLQMVKEGLREGDNVEVHLVTQSDPNTCEQQSDFLNKIKESYTNSNVRLSWELQNFHARSVETNTGWRISMDRGLDMFQKYEGGQFSLEARSQEARKMRGAEITYMKR